MQSNILSGIEGTILFECFLKAMPFVIALYCIGLRDNNRGISTIMGNTRHTFFSISVQSEKPWNEDLMIGLLISACFSSGKQMRRFLLDNHFILWKGFYL